MSINSIQYFYACKGSAIFESCKQNLYALQHILAFCQATLPSVSRSVSQFNESACT